MNRQTFYCEVVEWVRQLLLLARLVLEPDELPVLFEDEVPLPPVLDVFAPTCVSVAAGLTFVYVLPCAFFVGLAVDSVGYSFCCAVSFSTSCTNGTVVSPAVIFTEWI